MKPLKEIIERNEKFIMTLEEKAKKTEALLITASGAGDGDQISRLSQELKNMRSSIDVAFHKLEQASTEHDRIEGEFEEKLGDED